MTTPAGGDVIGDASIEVDADTDPAMRALARFAQSAAQSVSALNNRTRTSFTNVTSSISNAFTSVTDRIRSAFTSVGNFISNIPGFTLVSGAIRRLGSTAVATGSVIGRGLASGFSVATQAALSSLPVVTQALGAVSIAAAGSGAALAALPLAFAGLGAIALRESESVKAAFEDAGESISETLADAAEPLRPVFIDIAGQLTDIVDTLAPNLEAAFSATAPLLEPFVESLGILAQNLMPGLIAAVEAGGAPLQALGAGLEGLGTALSLFFGGLATGSEGAAAGLEGLLDVISAILPGIGQFLGSLAQIGGPILSALVGPIQTLVAALGAGLGPVLAGLEPALTTLGSTFGSIIEAIAPLLPIVGELAGSLLPPLATTISQILSAFLPLIPVVGQLVQAILPPLIPLVTLVGDAFVMLAPVIVQLGETLSAVLAPILATLPAIIGPLVQAVTSILQAVLPLVAQILVGLTPALVSLSTTFAQLIVAVTPLIVIVGQVLVQAITRLTPIITSLIQVFVRVTNVMTGIFSRAITSVVVPAVRLISNLLRGDFRGAINTAGTLLRNLDRIFQSVFRRIREVVFSVLRAVGANISSRLSRARSDASSALSAVAGFFRTQFNRARASTSSALNSVVTVLRSLPGRARGALAGAGSALVGAGRDLIRGMVNGIRDAAGSVVEAARGVARSAVDAAENLLGIGSPSKVFAEIGRNTGQGFIQGLTGTGEQIRRTTQNIAQSITTAFRGRVTGLDDRLVSLVQAGNRRLQGFAAERDRLADRIAQAQQRATDIEQQARGVFTLGEAAQAPVFNARRIETELLRADRTIQAFTKNVNTLARRGLSRQLLDQIVGLGPEQGTALARSLASQSDSYLQNINRLQGRVNESARNLGRLGADRLFDSGEQAGRGFLAGLRGQRRQIEDLMLSIARGMQRAIRRALKISSPSRVFEDIGMDTIRGLSSGVLQQMGDLRESMRVATDSLIPPGGVLPIEQAEAVSDVSGAVGALRPAVAGGSVVQINLTMSNQGVLGSREEVLNWLSTSLETLRRERRLPGVA